MESQITSQRRDDFLLAMYSQMWGNIDRHILVIWQSVAALLGAFAVLALIEKNVLPIDLACSILVVICAWVVAHVIDANYWFARNLVIITNIERQFLLASDLVSIHPYFRVHRKPTLLDHLAVQGALAAGVFSLIVGWHFFTRVVPGFTSPWRNFEVVRALPYLFTVASAVMLIPFRRKQVESYNLLLAQSPGIPVCELSEVQLRKRAIDS
jgi:hypothetical protein